MQNAKKVGLGQNNPKSKLFYTLLVILPSLQFLIFWVYVNFNSIILAFKVFDANATTSQDFSFGVKNFLHWFSDKYKMLGGKSHYYKADILPAIKVTLLTYVIGLLINMPLGLFFSYYMFKKMPGAGLFRVLLFMPSIISAAPLSVIFHEITYNLIGSTPGVDGWIPFNFWLEKNEFFTMILFNFFIGFGTSVLMYTNKMDAIAPEIIESAHLDGANGLKEFWYIVLPQAFSIIQVFLITGFAGAFTNQHNVLTLFNSWHPSRNVTSLGLVLWNGVRNGGDTVWDLAPYAALGLMITIIVVPLTFLFRWALDKFGWKEE